MTNTTLSTMNENGEIIVKSENERNKIQTRKRHSKKTFSFLKMIKIYQQFF